MKWPNILQHHDYITTKILVECIFLRTTIPEGITEKLMQLIKFLAGVLINLLEIILLSLEREDGKVSRALLSGNSDTTQNKYEHTEIPHNE